MADVPYSNFASINQHKRDKYFKVNINAYKYAYLESCMQIFINTDIFCIYI